MTIDEKTQNKALELLGLDITKCTFKKENKKLSLATLLTSPINNTTEYDDFLKKRKYNDLFDKADPDFKKDFAKTLMSAEAHLNQEITLENVLKEKIAGVVRSKASELNLQKLFEYIAEKNILLEPKSEIHLNIPYKDITFNPIVEGKYKQTHIAFDTEADSEGHTFLNTATNYELKRIVVGYLSEEFKIEYYKDSDWDYILLGTNNLWEAVLLADFEALIAVTLISSFEQGSIESLNLFQAIFDHVNIPINNNYLAEYLNNQRKSLCICHHNFYDINKLNANYKHAKKKRQKFNIIKTKKVEFLKIRYDTHDLYKIKMGNTTIGFRFNAKCNTRFNFFGIPQITVAPSQSRSFSIVNGVDTLNLADSFRFPKKTLGYLSKNLAYEKIDIDDKKIFTIADLTITAEKTITEKVKYNILDCLATTAVYGMLTYHFNFVNLSEILEIDLTVSKNFHKPITTKIISSATKPKFILEKYLEKKSNKTIKQIQANFELARNYLRNFIQTYKGGRSDGFIYGKIVSTNEEPIKYNDFESQYPNASRLIQAEKQMILAANGTIHEYLDYDLKSATNDFWKIAKYTIATKRKNKTLSDKFAEKILGNITIEFSKIPMLFRSKVKGRWSDNILQPTKKDSHIITTTMFDLLIAIEYAVLIEKIPLKFIKDNIKILATERLLLDKTPEFGSELSTKLIIERRKIKEKIKELKSDPNSSQYHINQLKTLEQDIKYMINALYGILAEGINDTNRTGTYQLISSSCLTTACARYLSYSAEILYRYNKATPIYTDTDSIIAKAKQPIHDSICNYFSKTITLKEEVDYGTIQSIYVLGKKKYGILDEKGIIHAKIHGTGSYAETLPVYEHMYKLLLTTNHTFDYIAEQIIPAHPIYQKFSYRKEKDSKIKGIKEILKHGSIVNQFKFNEITIYYLKYEKTKINEKTKKEEKTNEITHMFINTTSLTKGSFGNYLNIKKSNKEKILFVLAAPENFDEFIQKCLAIHPEVTTQITKQANAKKLIEKIYEALEPLTTALEPNFNIDPETDNVLIDNEMFDTFSDSYPSLVHVFKDFGSRRSSFQKYRQYTVALLKTLEMLSHTIINPKKPDWNSIYEGIMQEGITPTDFIDTFDNYAKLHGRLSKYHDYYTLHGESRTDNKVLDEIFNKRTLQNKFIKLMNFDKNRFMRKKKEKINDFIILEPLHRKKPVKNDILKEYRNNDKFDCDGFTYNYSVNLPRLDFSTKLKSDETYYYSQAIINTALTASNLYAKTHFTSKNKIKQLQDQYLNMQKEQLPFSKNNKNVLISLRIIPKISENDKIDMQTYKLLFDKPERKRFEKTKKSIVIKETNTVLLNDNGMFRRELKKLYRHEWLEVDWLGKKWSISLEKRASLNYNAMLSLKILLSGTNEGKRTFQASLRLNPSSKNLYNFDLFKISIKELDDNSHLGKILLEKLFDSKVVTYFKQQRATHVEDIIESEKPYEAYNLTYMSLACQILKAKMKHLNSKLSIVAYTKNLKTQTNVNILIPILSAGWKNIMSKYYDSFPKMRELLTEMGKLNVSQNRFSLGFNINNYEEKTTVSVYAKNFSQYLGKIKRVAKFERIEELPANILEKIKSYRELNYNDDDEHTLRLEITLRGWMEIHTKSYYRFLDAIAKIIRKVDLFLAKKERLANESLQTTFKKAIKYIERAYCKISKILEEENKDLARLKEEFVNGGLDPPIVN